MRKSWKGSTPMQGSWGAIMKTLTKRHDNRQRKLTSLRKNFTS